MANLKNTLKESVRNKRKKKAQLKNKISKRNTQRNVVSLLKVNKIAYMKDNFYYSQKYL